MKLYFWLSILFFGGTNSLISQTKTEGFWEFSIDYECSWGWKEDRSSILLSKDFGNAYSGLILGGQLTIYNHFGTDYSFKISGQEGCLREGKLEYSEFAGTEYLRGNWIASGNNAMWGSGLCCNGKLTLSRKAEKQKPTTVTKNTTKEKNNSPKKVDTHPETFNGTLKTGENYILKNVLFELSSDELLPESYSELSKVYDMLNANNKLVIQLEGHTDIIGPHKSNMRLSKQRVKATKKYLTKKGISPKRIKLKWFGDTRPIVKTGSVEERAVNRRVELRVLKAE